MNVEDAIWSCEVPMWVGAQVVEKIIEDRSC